MEGFYNRIWYLKKKIDLENTKNIVAEFKKGLSIEVRKEELPRKYIANKKFKLEYLRKLEGN